MCSPLPLVPRAIAGAGAFAAFSIADVTAFVAKVDVVAELACPPC
jgi:hypothetical protein